MQAIWADYLNANGTKDVGTPKWFHFAMHFRIIQLDSSVVTNSMYNLGVNFVSLYAEIYKNGDHRKCEFFSFTWNTYLNG